MPQLLAYIHDTPEHVISANHESVPTCGTFVPWWSCCPKVLGSGQMRMLFTAHYGSSNSIQSYQARPQYSHSIPTVFPLYPAIFPLHSHCIPTVFPHPDISVQVQSVTQNHAKRFPPKRRFISARVQIGRCVCFCTMWKGHRPQRHHWFHCMCHPLNECIPLTICQTQCPQLAYLLTLPC